MVELQEFPPELLEILFSYLPTKDLLTVSSLCTKFRDITCSERLINKITLYLNYPVKRSFMSTITKSKRKYRNLVITRERTRDFNSDYDRQHPSQLFSRLSQTITNLKLNWGNARTRESSLIDIIVRRNVRHRDGNNPELFDRMANIHTNLAQVREELRNELYREFIDILHEFPNVVKMDWTYVQLEKGGHANLNFRNLKELSFQQCDAYCFNVVASCTRLESFKITDPFWGSSRNPGVDNFESFLISQVQLKDLKITNIQYPRLFHIDNTQQIQFKLNHLELKNVFFKEKNCAENFFKTQDQLRSVSFQVQNERVRCLEELQWYNNIIKTVLTNNTLLHTIIIEKLKYRFENYDFLSGVKNPNVKKLVFNVTSEDENAELFKLFIQIFPNLCDVTFKAEESEDTTNNICFNKSTTLAKVERLTIINSSVRSLLNLHAEELTFFEFQPGKTGEFIDDYIGGFLYRHRNIKHLVIGSKAGHSYFFVSYNLCQLIVNFLNQLESIAIYNFAEVNNSVKLLCTLRNLKLLTLSSLQHQQFTAKTKIECERKKLKLNVEHTKLRADENAI